MKESILAFISDQKIRFLTKLSKTPNQDCGEAWYSPQEQPVQ